MGRLAQTLGASAGTAVSFDQKNFREPLMKLVSACEGCGKGVTGALTRLTQVNGRYLCPDCLSNPEGKLQYYCTACHSYSTFAKPKGNKWIELVLYLFYIIPGIIYSIWRRSGNTKVCPKCGSNSIITSDSGTHVKCPDCAELVLKEARKCKHCGCSLVPQ